MKKLKPYDMIHANMVCPKCGKKADTLLLVNKQGMIKVDTYICSDCFIVMEREIPEHYRAG